LSDVTVELGDDRVAVVEIHRPPENFFDAALIEALADAYERLGGDDGCRAILLCSEGKHFCAGARLGPGGGEKETRDLYRHGARMLAAPKPVVAAVQGAAVGGGLGVALSADLRVASPESRFTANFSKLGFHHGFGLTVTLPEVAGKQVAYDLLYTGRRVRGEEAKALGLCDRLVETEAIRDEARALAAEIAASAPLAVQAIRATMRDGLVERFRAATEREATEQARLAVTEDFREGVAATAERRTPNFTGR
jgi:2-(1,2-epoxy-1,2-dihydrophenyl)acetyl-CoA isomerase